MFVRKAVTYSDGKRMQVFKDVPRKISVKNANRHKISLQAPKALQEDNPSARCVSAADEICTFLDSSGKNVASSEGTFLILEGVSMITCTLS
jgi:hypothetical protein